MASRAVSDMVFSRQAFNAALLKARLEPADLARQTGVSLAAIGRWMSGESVPRQVALNSVARVLRVKVIDLMELP